MRSLVRLAGPILALGLVFASLPPGALAAGTVTVSTASTTLGAVLVGPGGLTLYTHAGDTSTTSTCTGSCAAAWPPLLVPAGQQAVAGAGVTGHLGTLVRPEGTTQVTYNGRALYAWQGDSVPGDVTGQGVDGFSVATPGSAVTKPATAIQGSIRAGATRAGPFLTGRTLSIADGHSATVRFHLGTAFAGRTVTILRSTRGTDGHWSAFQSLTVRHVEADGYVYVFLHVHGWEAFRARYAGDSTHGAGTSASVVAHGH